MIISINGSLCEQERAVVSVYDHGFLYGIGLFETFRTYDGRPYLLGEHLWRLAEGCSALGIDFLPDGPEIEKTVTQLLIANGMRDAYFRLSVSAGEDKLGLPSESYSKPNVVLYVKDLPSPDVEAWEKGRALQRLKLRRNTPEGPVRSKSFHYMNNILGKRELSLYPWAKGAEGLFLNADGCVAEGIVSNIFFVQKGVCMTPAVETGILPGITRDRVIHLLEEEGIPFRVGFYGWTELERADEIFLTNSIQEVVPVTRLFDQDGSMHKVADGKPGAVTRTISALYLQGTRRGKHER